MTGEKKEKERKKRDDDMHQHSKGEKKGCCLKSEGRKWGWNV
jgi:hypothetical protein